MTPRTLVRTALAVAVGLGGCAAFAKLPPPSDEAKAKAAEAAAKTAWSGKVAAFQLCKSQDKVAAAYLAQARKDGKAANPIATPPCADPGPFVYPPPEAGAAPAVAATPAKK